MALPPAATPIMRSRSRRLGDATAELFSIPTSTAKERLPVGRHGRLANPYRISYHMKRGRNQGGAIIRAQGRTGRVHADARANSDRYAVSYLHHLRFLYYTRDITKSGRLRGW